MIVKTKTAEAGKSPPIRNRKQFILSALEKFEQPLTRYAQRLLGSRDLEGARDAVQHTFLKLCEQDLEPIQHRIGPWLYSVCRNRIIDLFRAKGNQTESWPEAFQVTDAHPGPAEKVEQDDFYHRISQLIGQLTGLEREIIELWSQGLSHGEVADILDKSNGAVRMGLFRGIKKLKQHPEVAEWLERATGPSSELNSQGGASSLLASKRRSRKQTKPR